MHLKLIITILLLILSSIVWGQTDIWQVGEDICMTKEKAAVLAIQKDSLDWAIQVIDSQSIALNNASLTIDTRNKAILEKDSIIAHQKSIMLIKDDRIETLTLASQQYYSALKSSRKENKRIKRERTWIIVGSAILVVGAGVAGYHVGKGP